MIPGTELQQPASRSEQIIIRLFARMQAIYGSLWTSQWKTDEQIAAAMVEWKNALVAYSVDVLKAAIDACLKYHERPPTLPQFLSRCREAKKPHIPAALPAPERKVPHNIRDLLDMLRKPPELPPPVGEMADMGTGETVPVYMDDRGRRYLFLGGYRRRVPREWPSSFQPMELRNGKVTRREAIESPETMQLNGQQAAIQS